MTPTTIVMFLVGIIGGWCVGQLYLWRRGRKRLADLNRRIAERHRWN